MSLLTDISAIITAAIPAETNIFLFREPPDPAAIITLYLNGGPAPTQDFSGNDYREQNVQVRIRDPVARTLESRVDALYAVFRLFQLYPAVYVTVGASSQPFFGYPLDQNGRSIASFNLRCRKGSTA
jgi:hypothetical protein